MSYQIEVLKTIGLIMADEAIIWDKNIRVQVNRLKTNPLMCNCQVVRQTAYNTVWAVRKELRGSDYSGPEKLGYIKAVRERIDCAKKEIDGLLPLVGSASAERTLLNEAKNYFCFAETLMLVHEPKIRVKITGIGIERKE